MPHGWLHLSAIVGLLISTGRIDSFCGSTAVDGDRPLRVLTALFEASVFRSEERELLNRTANLL